MNLKAVRFDRLNSIYHLNNLFDEVIEGFKRKGFESSPYNVSRSFGEHWSGRCMRLKRLKRSGGENAVYPVLCIDFKDDTPVICLTFDRDWCGPVFEKFSGKDKAGSHFRVCTALREVRFELAPANFEEFGGAPLYRQRAILEEFLNKSVDEIARFL